MTVYKYAVFLTGWIVVRNIYLSLPRLIWLPCDFGRTETIELRLTFLQLVIDLRGPRDTYTVGRSLYRDVRYWLGVFYDTVRYPHINPLGLYAPKFERVLLSLYTTFVRRFEHQFDAVRGLTIFGYWTKHTPTSDDEEIILFDSGMEHDDECEFLVALRVGPVCLSYWRLL